jgi:hypothetical protein
MEQRKHVSCDRRLAAFVPLRSTIKSLLLVHESKPCSNIVPLDLRGVSNINWLQVIGNGATAGSKARCSICRQRDLVLVSPGLAPVRPHLKNIVWAMIL